MTYIKTSLSDALTDLPSELAGFSPYNAAIVAFRYAGRRRSQVPISRWLQLAELCSKTPAGDVGQAPGKGLTLAAILESVGLSKKVDL